MDKKEKVLFLCTQNSARSQMAEGLMRNLLNRNYEVHSAGIIPTEVNPNAIQVMKEIGIDISTQRSKSINEFKNSDFDYVITVCDNAKETCPFFPGKKIIHKGFNDPVKSYDNSEDVVKEFRKIRDEIREWILKNF
jgi:arsenate reductase